MKSFKNFKIKKTVVIDIILVIALLVGGTLISKAETHESNETHAAYVNKMSYIPTDNKVLVRAFDLSEDQLESVKYEMTDFSNKLRYTFESEPEYSETRGKMLWWIVDNNIKSMRQVLNDKQYRKYLRILNVTINNREFNLVKP